MKRIFKLDRLRLRGLTGAKDEVLLTATAQNLRRLAKFLCRARMLDTSSASRSTKCCTASQSTASKWSIIPPTTGSEEWGREKKSRALFSTTSVKMRKSHTAFYV
jgi:hypothetical protein